MLDEEISSVSDPDLDLTMLPDDCELLDPAMIIHKRNVQLHAALKDTGMIGAQHSRMINRLAEKYSIVEPCQSKMNFKRMTTQKKESIENGNIQLAKIIGQITVLKKKIDHLEKQKYLAAKEGKRMGELMQNYKQSSIQLDQINQTLSKNHERDLQKIAILQAKIQSLVKLNNCLINIFQSTVKTLPRMEKNYKVFFEAIQILRQNLQKTEKNASTQVKINHEFGEMVNKLQGFKHDIEIMENDKIKLITNLCGVRHESKSLNLRISMLSSLNVNEIEQISQDIECFSETFNLKNTSQHLVNYISNPLMFQITHVLSVKIPVSAQKNSANRADKYFKEICLLFDQQVHLLETQKMDFQYSKNRRLQRAQKWECEQCNVYQRIIKQVFSIVRETFKQIKCWLLKEFKNDGEPPSTEVPMLL